MTYEINETTYSEGEYQQMQNLICKYADANLKQQEYYDKASVYWAGVRDTYQAVLNSTYGGDWAPYGSIGHYVFVQGQAYLTAKESAKEFQITLRKKEVSQTA